MPRYEPPWQEEPDRPPGGTVYDGRARRLAGDPLLCAALAVGAAGVLLGLLFAAGALFDGGRPALVAPPGSVGADSPAPTPGGSAAGSNTPESTATATPPPSPTPSPVPPATPAATPGPTEPRLLRSVASALCLDVVATGVPEGADVHQAPCGAAPSQRWRPAPAGGVFFTLVNVASGRCLDVDRQSRADGAAAQQRACTGRASQRWRLVRPGTGATMLVSANSGKCLDLPAADPTPGTRVRQFSCLGTANQQWIEQPAT